MSDYDAPLLESVEIINQLGVKISEHEDLTIVSLCVKAEQHGQLAIRQRSYDEALIVTVAVVGTRLQLWQGPRRVQYTDQA